RRRATSPKRSSIYAVPCSLIPRILKPGTISTPCWRYNANRHVLLDSGRSEALVSSGTLCLSEEGDFMIWGLARRVLLIGVILLLPVAAFAQEAVLTGTITDSTGAVLPGVTVTAS